MRFGYIQHYKRWCSHATIPGPKPSFLLKVGGSEYAVIKWEKVGGGVPWGMRGCAITQDGNETYDFEVSPYGLHGTVIVNKFERLGDDG